MKRYLLAISAGVLLPLVVFAGPDDPISSSGVVSVSVAEAGGTQKDAGFEGTGKVPEIEGANITPLSAEDIAHIKALPALGGAANPENIIAIDTRSKLTPTSYPARATALITFSGARCTGWLIGPNTVVTAGHCVHSGGNFGDWYPVSSYKVYPGYTGSSAPYGYCTAYTLYSVTGWTQNASPNYDYGVVKLNCTVGNSTGWFGYANRGSVLNYPTIINGYPGDKPLEQWLSADKVRSSSSQRVYYKNDTYGGMSGSPVWYDDGTGPWGIAIHTYGGNSLNSGTRINSSVFNNLKSWKNAS